jgi:peptidoglycan hydrolase CwlO-like protein
MNKGAKIFWVVAGIAVTQQVWAASSISTRVKVVEEKIKMHDKKLRDLAAQQELTNKQVESLKMAREDAEKAIAAKAEMAKQAAVVSTKVAAAKAKQHQETGIAKKPDVTSGADEALLSMNARPRYAFP